MYAIEAPKLLSERTAEDEEFMVSSGKGRPVAPACDECEDNPNMQCRSCGCKSCAGKEDEHTLLICDECEHMFHMKCLIPPLLEVPEDPHWYCPECKNDENEIVKVRTPSSIIRRDFHYQFHYDSIYYRQERN